MCFKNKTLIFYERWFFLLKKNILRLLSCYLSKKLVKIVLLARLNLKEKEKII